jgi:enoyl-CoA hydratase
MGLGEEVLLDVTDGVAVVTINRPDKLNAINDATLSALQAAFDQIQEDRSIRAAVITGSGRKAFTVGVDIDAMQDGPHAARAFVARELTMLYDRAVRLRVPIIAAIEGYAYATGSEFTMCCDLAYAGESARFCFPDLSLGLAVACGAWRPSEKLNRMRVSEWMLTGATFTADQAYEVGLLTRMVPNGKALDTALETAKTIATKAPVGVEISKKALNRRYADDWMAFLDLQQVTIYSQDFAEGLQAFREKRPPQFQGR